MVYHPIVHELLLLALLWHVVMSYGRWKRDPAPQHLPAQYLQRLPQAPKAVAGLTHMPHCQACEHGLAPSDQPPLAPPPVIIPKRGRPRTIDTHTQYCPTKTCAYYGWVGHGNIRANGHPGSGPWRQLHCVACDTYFLETQGTLLHGKTLPVDL